MKVMCISEDFNLGKLDAPVFSEIVTVCGQCSVYPDNWDIEEYYLNRYGERQSFRKILFAPLSNIDETELIKERELVNQ